MKIKEGQLEKSEVLWANYLDQVERIVSFTHKNSEGKSPFEGFRSYVKGDLDASTLVRRVDRFQSILHSPENISDSQTPEFVVMRLEKLISHIPAILKLERATAGMEYTLEYISDCLRLLGYPNEKIFPEWKRSWDTWIDECVE